MAVGALLDRDTVAAREAAVTGLTGSPLWVVALFSVVLPAAVAASLIAPRILPLRTASARTSSARTAVSYLALVVPVVMAMTVHPGLPLAAAVAVPVAATVAVAAAVYPYPYPKPKPQPQRQPRIAHISSYRSVLMVSTAAAILAVDFGVFPRCYAKTESFGVSIMDVGVGSFVFSKGLVSDPGKAKPAAMDLLRGLAPLLIMAHVRLVVHAAIGYQEHVSEYGVHWNFYHSLIGVIVAGWLIPRVSRTAAGAVAIAIAAVYQGVLLMDGARLQESLLDPNPESRGTSLIAANREGIASLSGFAALFLLGSCMGGRASLASPGRIGAAAAAAWAVYAAMTGPLGLLPSRRLANAPYVAWITAHNLSLVWSLAWVHRALGAPRVVSRAVAFVNGNQLRFFLIANLCTGATNVLIDTLKVGDGPARALLVAYLCVVGLLVSLIRT